MTFSEAQIGVILRSLPRVESQLGSDYRTLLERLIEAPMTHVDANHLIGLLLELGKPLSFNSRIRTIKDLQEEINGHRTCRSCGKYLGFKQPTGNFCPDCTSDMNRGYKGFDDLKAGYHAACPH